MLLFSRRPEQLSLPFEPAHRAHTCLYLFWHQDKGCERLDDFDQPCLGAADDGRLQGQGDPDLGKGPWRRLAVGAAVARDVYEAIGSPPLFNVGPGAEPADCLVENAVDARLNLALKETERRLLQQFSEISMEDLAQDFEHRFATLYRDEGESAKTAFSHSSLE